MRQLIERTQYKCSVGSCFVSLDCGAYLSLRLLRGNTRDSYWWATAAGGKTTVVLLKLISESLVGFLKRLSLIARTNLSITKKDVQSCFGSLILQKRGLTIETFSFRLQSVLQSRAPVYKLQHIGYYFIIRSRCKVRMSRTVASQSVLFDTALYLTTLALYVLGD